MVRGWEKPCADSARGNDHAVKNGHLAKSGADSQIFELMAL